MRSGTRLTSFLRRYSSKAAADSVRKLYKEWTLIEVRDTGRRDNLICPCGRSGLRYICFIRNKRTHVQTYVGSSCIRHFSNKTLPLLLMLLENLARSGISGKYLGPHGGGHNFWIRPKARVVRHRQLLSHFFSHLPVRRARGGRKRGGRGGWVMTVRTRKNQYTFHTPRLKARQWYNVRIGPVTSRGKDPRPKLIFYADRIRKV